MKTNKARLRLYKILSFLVYVIPLAILFTVESGRYLKSSGNTLSFFGYIIVAFAIIAFKDKVLTFAKNNTILTVSIIIFVISLIMRYLADELLLISGVSLFGALLSTIIEPVCEVYRRRAERDEESGEQNLLSHKNAWRLAYGFRIEE